ncbi:unnamed protein product [Brassica oleracea]
MIWFGTPIDSAAVRERRLQENWYKRLFSHAVKSDRDWRSNSRRPESEFSHEKCVEVSMQN